MFKVCTRFLSLLTLCGTLCASDAAAATSVSVTATQMPRLKLFNVFSMANESTSSALASSSSTSRDASAISAEQAAVKEAASDFIVISELQSSASAVNGNQTAGGEDVSFLDFLTETYQTTTHKQILYNRTSWELIEEGSSHEVRACFLQLYLSCFGISHVHPALCFSLEPALCLGTLSVRQGKQRYVHVSCSRRMEPSLERCVRGRPRRVHPT